MEFVENAGVARVALRFQLCSYLKPDTYLIFLGLNFTLCKRRECYLSPDVPVRIKC